MPAGFKEQGDFEELDDGTVPAYYFDRPPAPLPPTRLRPTQALLPVPDLATLFVMPKWDPAAEPDGWTYLSGVIGDDRLTEVEAVFTYRRDMDGLVMTIAVMWDDDAFGFKTVAWGEQPTTWDGTAPLKVDIADIERASLGKVVRYFDLHTMVSTTMSTVTCNRIVRHSGIGLHGPRADEARSHAEIDPRDGQHPEGRADS
jgi:hypothetical protein